MLTDHLKSDIETYPLISHIKRNYAQVYSPEYASLWMENALINLLNDNRGLAFPLNDRLRRIFPNSTDEDIKKKLLAESHVHRLWIITPSSLRREMHAISCNMLVHYISHS